MRTKPIIDDMRIRLASQIYSVATKDFDDPDTDAELNHNDKCIYLKPEYGSLAEMVLCLLHEVMHGIKAEYGVRVSHADIDRIAQGMTQAVFALLRLEE